MGNFYTVQSMNAENKVKRAQELWESRSVFSLCTLIFFGGGPMFFPGF